MPAAKLKDLHSAIIATLNGFKEALAKSDDADISALCRDMVELRSAHHGELHPALERLGETADDGETILALISSMKTSGWDQPCPDVS